MVEYKYSNKQIHTTKPY